MAIDPRISLGVNSVDVGGAINNALLNAQRIQGIQQSKSEAPLRNQLLQQQVTGAEQANAGAQEQARLSSLITGAAELTPLIADAKANNDMGPLVRSLGERRQRLIAEGKPTNDTDEAFAMLGQGPEGLGRLEQATTNLTNLGFQTGVLKPAGGTITSGERTRNQLLSDLRSEDVQISDSAAIALGLKPRAVGSSSQTIAGDPSLTASVATSQQEIAQKTAEGKETGTTIAIGKGAPTIAKAKALITKEVKLAEKAAIEKGEVLTDLGRAKAALPGLIDVVGKLRELAPIATSTFGGRVWDAAVKETGFGATKGATASAKFGAMVNNQVLPLLKPTFGGSFSVQEGQELKATMGDVNASVEEKMATLDAFIEQRQRDIEGKQLQLDQSSQQDLKSASDEDLLNF